MRTENKIIVLTGGSSGVGLELLKLLAPSNRVVNLSRRVPPFAEVTHVETDLADGASVAAAIATIAELHPSGIAGLINCAAIQLTPKFTDADFDRCGIAREITVNLTSPIQLVAGLLPLLTQHPGAFILNINSGLGIVPKRESAVYCASKGGLDNFSRGLRPQLAKTGITVHQAFLPLVDTPMTEGRGSGKLSAEDTARRILGGLERGILDHDIGKSRLLRAIARISPALAHRIMQKESA